MRRVLITGGKGMFASDCARLMEQSAFAVVALSHQQLDVTNRQQVIAAMQEVKPAIVVHTVGLSVDDCELHPAEAHRVHVWGTGLIARHCERVGAVLVNISTCGLFGDEKKFYAEYDLPSLKTHYARSKYLAEREAVHHCSRTFTVRPGWLFGGALEHKKNFVYQRYLEARRKDVLHSANDKFGCPTWTEDLVRGIIEVIETEEYGLYHLTNADGGSRYDYVKAIVDAFGLSTVVEAVDSHAYPRPAPVPACELLANQRRSFLGLAPLPPWRDAVERYVVRLKGLI